MAQRHWLDPLARQLLIASGQLARPGRDAAAVGGTPPGPPLPLRGWIQAARQVVASAGPAERPPQPSPLPQPWQQGPSPQEASQQETIERDLLALQLAQQPGRRLRDGQEVQRAAALGWRLDVNRATAADWLRLPGCSPDQADLLQRLQAGGVQLSGPEDLQRLLQLDPARLADWLPLLEFRWYGEPPPVALPPLAVNAAAAPELRQLQGLDERTLAQLLQQRSHQPFRDLADLQARLGLSAGLIESWIGRLSFEPPPPGPSLPRPQRPSR